MADHSFDPEIAKDVGVVAATIYRNIKHWCAHHRANNKHIHDGVAWTYNSVKAWNELYPYLSQKQIRTALDKLVDAGLIAVGEFNKDNRDRTKWYCDLDESNCPQGQMHLPSAASPTVAQKGKPLPDIIPDKNNTPLSPPNGKSRSKFDYSDLFEQFWSAYPSKPHDPKPVTWEVFKKLTPVEQQSAINAVPAFKQSMEGEDHRPMQAVRFLRQRVFQNFEAQAKADASLPERVFVAQHDDNWGAVAKAYAIQTGKQAKPIHNNGTWFDVELVNSIATEAAE